MSAALPDLTATNWIGKASAATVLGFWLAIGLSGLFASFGPGGLTAGTGKVQFNMWMIAPLWTAVLCACFMFRSGLRAWLWLGAANVLVYALLWGGRALSGAT
ncbi:MAG: hypothetical protein QM696_06850 [Steroidobacteraceae bacterium]